MGNKEEEIFLMTTKEFPKKLRRRSDQVTARGERNLVYNYLYLGFVGNELTPEQAHEQRV